MVSVVIQGGRRNLDTGFLEAASEQLLRARTSNHRIEISLDIVQGLIREVLHRRREEKETLEEIEKIVSSMEEVEKSGPQLPVSESRLAPAFPFDGLEITDLEQLVAGSSSSSVEEQPEDDEPEPEEEVEATEEAIRVRPKRRFAVLRSKRRIHRIPSVNIMRILVISLLGFLLLAGLALFGG